jgi:RNA polymerase sigma-70 factor (ECF subfamily)
MEEVVASPLDPVCFEPLYNRYYPRILSFVYQRLDSKETAKDITAQVFYRAMDKLKKYQPIGLPFSAWLYRIALNELNAAYRQKKSRRTIYLDHAGQLALQEELPELSSEMTDKQLWAALQILDTVDLDLVDMRFLRNGRLKN